MLHSKLLDLIRLKRNLSFCVLRATVRHLSSKPFNRFSPQLPESEELRELIEKYETKVLYSSFIETYKPNLGYIGNKALVARVKREVGRIQKALENTQPLPITLKYLGQNFDTEKSVDQDVEDQNSTEEVCSTQFPYTNSEALKEDVKSSEENTHMSTEDEIRARNKELKHWMTSYDNFEHDLKVVECEDTDEWSINYGTPDPKSRVSNIPCGGCGALLHCKDTSIPGYIPSEIYRNCNKDGGSTLHSIICQRCYFLKEHNTALQVRVSPEDYPKILATIKNKNALVILMVDLMDFPCSIWPGIADILGPKIPVYIVGNKVDLLPKDHSRFLDHVKNTLIDEIKLCGFGSSNILGISLISAKTGFGVESFISALYYHWKYKGDIYLVGCTNVGKSSLFNALIQSDYCKVQASDLIQRATVSQWPGTTLNLLKFPIMRPSSTRFLLRKERLEKLKAKEIVEEKGRKDNLKLSNDPKYATLIGHIGQSFTKKKDYQGSTDVFVAQSHSNTTGSTKLGINEKHPDYIASHWCFDTPGVVQPEQIINLLTVEELMCTVPKEIIRPETFRVRAGTSLFIAGLARLDYIDGPDSIRLTVFRSNELPLTICPLENADSIYKECLGTELFKVPINEGDRLSKWPGLESSKVFTITGYNPKESCKDVVLSSAGWVAINCGPEDKYHFQAWTPEKRGIHLRECLLPRAVTLRGQKIRHSVAYKSHKFII